jgi:hypothetical protein
MIPLKKLDHSIDTSKKCSTDNSNPHEPLVLLNEQQSFRCGASLDHRPRLRGVDAVEAAMHAWSGGACNSQLASICFEADLEQLKHFSLQDLWDVDASYVLKILRSARNLS